MAPAPGAMKALVALVLCFAAVSTATPPQPAQQLDGGTLQWLSGLLHRQGAGDDRPATAAAAAAPPAQGQQWAWAPPHNGSQPVPNAKM
eukprot:SAG22_NODE_11732_length_471_cov_1.346774_1_plen_88_part_10